MKISLVEFDGWGQCLYVTLHYYYWLFLNLFSFQIGDIEMAIDSGGRIGIWSSGPWHGCEEEVVQTEVGGQMVGHSVADAVEESIGVNTM